MQDCNENVEIFYEGKVDQICVGYATRPETMNTSTSPSFDFCISSIRYIIVIFDYSRFLDGEVKQ